MLFVEPLIIARLAGIPGMAASVHSLADFSKEALAGRRLPALFVGTQGYRIADARSSGAVRVACRHLVAVATRHVGDVRGGSGAKAAADDLAVAVMARLHRWQPTPDVGPLLPIDPPAPEYATGVLIYPLAFECLQLIHIQE